MTPSKSPAKAAKAPKKKAAARSKPLSVEDLLERTIATVSAVEWKRHQSGRQIQLADELIGAIAACQAAGREDLAQAIFDTLPVQRARVQLQTGLGDPGAAVDSLLVALEEVRDKPFDAARLAGSLLEASSALRGKTERVAELDAAVAKLVEGSLESDGVCSLLGGAVKAYASRGEQEPARRILEQTLKFKDAKGHGLPSDMAFAVWLIETPERIVEITNQTDSREVLSSDLASLKGWSFEQVLALAAVSGPFDPRPLLAAMLMKLERAQEARKLVLEDASWEHLKAESRIERYELLGDVEAATKLKKEAAAADASAAPQLHGFHKWAEPRLQDGSKTFAELWPMILSLREPDKSVTLAIGALGALIKIARTQGATTAEVTPAIEAIEALFAQPFRTPHDNGQEGRYVNFFKMLKAEILIADGDTEAAQAEVESALANLHELLQFANSKDRSMISFNKGGLLRDLAKRAAFVGRPDLALKIALKVPNTYQREHAVEVGRYFLPDVNGLLAAIEKLAKPAPQEALLSKGLLAELWTAVLAAEVDQPQ